MFVPFSFQPLSSPTTDSIFSRADGGQQQSYGSGAPYGQQQGGGYVHR
jgi:hypothetical protein